MKLVLMDLWGFVEGTEVAPKATDHDKKEKEIKIYKTCSEKAYSLIAMSVSKNIQVHLMKTTCPKKAWGKEGISITQIVCVNRQFYSATMKEDGDIVEHITYMTSLAEKLRELKKEVDDKKVATVILGSLPESYENFLTSLNARNASELKWDDVDLKIR